MHCYPLYSFFYWIIYIVRCSNRALIYLASDFVSHGQARLAEIDLFSENGGVREASVLRYKEKRRTRLFSKKIRYQVRKVNADRRPRMKVTYVLLSLFVCIFYDWPLWVPATVSSTFLLGSQYFLARFFQKNKNTTPMLVNTWPQVL